MTKTANTPKTKKRKTHDWEAIELDYRAGVLTLRQIGEKNGVSHAAISKRAKRYEWERDLKTKIQAKADALVTRATVTKEVTKETLDTEREIVSANGEAIAQVRLAHRKDINRSRNITMSLLEELELQTGAETVAMLEQLGDMLRNEDDRGQDRLNDLYRKVISLPGRAKTMKDLGESLRVMVNLERQAFGLDDDDNSPTDGLTSLLHGIANNSGNAFMPVATDPELESEPEGSALPVSPDGEG